MKAATLDQFPVGHSEQVTVTITAQMLDTFGELSGDTNPVHMDRSAARTLGFADRVTHGVLTLSFVSRLIGMKLPGTGALWRGLKVNWVKPVLPGDQLTIRGTVRQASASTGSLLIDVVATNQNGATMLSAEATVGLGQLQAEASAEASSTAAQEPPATQGGAARAVQARGDCPVLITGGSGGIGGATALALARQGHPVVVGYCRSEQSAQEVVERVERGGGAAAAVQLDVTNRPSIERAVVEANARFGPLLGLVHAASPALDQTTLEALDPDVLQRFWSTYVLGGQHLVSALLPAMRASKHGRVVFVGTSAVIGTPPPKMGAYVVAKSAMLALSSCLATELGRHGVTVNTISPGFTLTDLTRDTSPRVQLAEAQRNPMRRIATPEDSAALIAFLLGPESSYINGAHVPVTGGAIQL